MFFTLVVFPWLVGWRMGWLKIWCTHSRDSAPLINYCLNIRHHLLFSYNLINQVKLDNKYFKYEHNKQVKLENSSYKYKQLTITSKRVDGMKYAKS